MELMMFELQTSMHCIYNVMSLPIELKNIGYQLSFSTNSVIIILSIKN
jgi:hypothetical protein